MGNTEDIYWEIHHEIKKLNLQKEFNLELEKLKQNDKFKHMETHRKWQNAFEKVIKNLKKDD